MSQSEEKTRHDRTVALIAQERFPYPDSQNPSWKTYLNEPQHTMAITGKEVSVYPDIVVVDTQKNQAAMIGEIETPMTVNEEGATQWKKYSSLVSTFYLYVPVSVQQEVRRLLASYGISVTGLRVYSYDAQGGITISNV